MTGPEIEKLADEIRKTFNWVLDEEIFPSTSEKMQAALVEKIQTRLLYGNPEKDVVHLMSYLKNHAQAWNDRLRGTNELLWERLDSDMRYVEIQITAMVLGWHIWHLGRA